MDFETTVTIVLLIQTVIIIVLVIFAAYLFKQNKAAHVKIKELDGRFGSHFLQAKLQFSTITSFISMMIARELARISPTCRLQLKLSSWRDGNFFLIDGEFGFRHLELLEELPAEEIDAVIAFLVELEWFVWLPDMLHWHKEVFDLLNHYNHNALALGLLVLAVPDKQNEVREFYNATKRDAFDLQRVVTASRNLNHLDFSRYALDVTITEAAHQARCMAILELPTIWKLGMEPLAHAELEQKFGNHPDAFVNQLVSALLSQN
jgi:hypothetical protein